MYLFSCFQHNISPLRLERILSIFESCSLRVNTKSTYSAHQKTYINLARKAGANPEAPLSQKQFCLVIILYSLSHKITSLPSFISAIAKLYELNQFGPLPRGDYFERVRKGLLNYYAHKNCSQPKTAISLNDLKLIRSKLNLSRFEDARDWCAYLFAFFGLLRVGEYTNGRLLLRDIQSDCPSDRVRISIPFSKTIFRPSVIDISARNDDLCPRKALANYISLLPLHLRKKPNTPLFLLHQNEMTPLSDSIFISRFRHFLSRARPEVDPSTYAGHSFRRGGATALYLAGVPEPVIQIHGRWKSLTSRFYLDKKKSDAARVEATRALLSSAPSSFFFSNPSSFQLPASLELDFNL